MKFLALASLFALASCSRKDEPPPDIQATKQTIWEVVKAYHAAGDKGDVPIMKSYLAPEIRMFKGLEDFAAGVEECTAELTERVKRFEGQHRNTLLGREFISITGDVAVVTYVANVGQLRAPITAVFRKSQGKWLLSHLHESWPKN